MFELGFEFRLSDEIRTMPINLSNLIFATADKSSELEPLNPRPPGPFIIMKKMLSCLIIGMILLGGAFWGCSDRKEPPPEKGAIRQMTDEVARDAVNQIRTPIDKARSAAKQQEEKNRELDDALKRQ